MFPEVRREDAAVLNPSDVGSDPWIAGELCLIAYRI